MKQVPELKTARLALRGIREEDTQFIIKLRSNPEVYQYFLFNHRITKEEHINWYRHNFLTNENRIEWIAFDIDNNLIGIFGLKRHYNCAEEAEVSYILSPEQYGKGYGKEAVEQIIQFGRDEWKCKSVIAEIHKNNVNSIRFIKGLGFVLNEAKGTFFIFRINV